MAEARDHGEERAQVGRPLIFISHDSRDAALAEAFSRLLSSVSAGVLKSFRSSDKQGTQGIEYGVEWYPEVMKQLDASSDVVCLLTPNSVGRPWILYEAGVAKGKLSTPVHGLALGIPLQQASAGPFAQFQNSDDSEDGILKLIMQLVDRIPNAEPDRDVVRVQVGPFRAKVAELTAPSGKKEKPDGTDSASVAQLFEEVKVMFSDLPARIERRVEGSTKRQEPRHLMDLVSDLPYMLGGEFEDASGLVILTSAVRDEFPWLYDISLNLYDKLDRKTHDRIRAIDKFERLLDFSFRNPVSRQFIRSGSQKSFYLQEYFNIIRMYLGRMREIERSTIAERASSPTARPSGGGEQKKG